MYLLIFCANYYELTINLLYRYVRNKKMVSRELSLKTTYKNRQKFIMDIPIDISNQEPLSTPISRT